MGVRKKIILLSLALALWCAYIYTENITRSMKWSVSLVKFNNITSCYNPQECNTINRCTDPFLSQKLPIECNRISVGAGRHPILIYRKRMKL